MPYLFVNLSGGEAKRVAGLTKDSIVFQMLDSFIVAVKTPPKHKIADQKKEEKNIA